MKLINLLNLIDQHLKFLENLNEDFQIIEKLWIILVDIDIHINVI